MRAFTCIYTYICLYIHTYVCMCAACCGMDRELLITGGRGVCKARIWGAEYKADHGDCSTTKTIENNNNNKKHGTNIA